MFKDAITMLALYVMPLLQIVGILSAVHAVMYVRSPRGVVAWVISLVTVPWIAIPLYWIFGRYRFQGYVKARRLGNSRLNALVREVNQKLEPARLDYDHPHQVHYNFYESLAGLKATNGNRITLLSNGEELFDTMFRAVESARHYVLIQFFIVNDDELGRRFQQLLMRKAEQEVKVYLLIDDIGSRRLPARYYRKLNASGVRAFPFRSSKGLIPRLQVNFRNHRKTVIVDGRMAYTGGFNIGNEYLGKTKKFGAWRDTHVEIVGPAVQSMQIPYLEDWYWITQEMLELEWVPRGAGPDNQDLLVVPTGPADDLETCHLFFLELIDSATDRLWICSPYFVPDQGLVKAIQRAAMRGVDVRILIPAKPDHLLVYLSAFSYFDEMFKVGVKLFRYQPGFMHQKVLLVDQRLASVGSANLDNRSCFLNFELGVLTADRVAVGEVESMLKNDFERSVAITSEEYHSRSFWFKFCVRSARILSPLQ